MVVLRRVEAAAGFLDDAVFELVDAATAGCEVASSSRSSSSSSSSSMSKTCCVCFCFCVLVLLVLALALLFDAEACVAFLLLRVRHCVRLS